MKTSLNLRQCFAFSMIDLLILVGMVALVAVLLLPMIAKRTARASRINCVSHLKQVGMSFRVWASDHDEKYPMEVSTNGGGTMELLASGLVTPHFKAMSNVLVTPRILTCPADIERGSAADFASLQDTNLSYFVVPEAQGLLPGFWLSGDRGLAVNGVAMKSGAALISTNSLMSWTDTQHQRNGNLAFADGSVQQTSSARLALSATNALDAYYAATSNTTFRILLP